MRSPSAMLWVRAGRSRSRPPGRSRSARAPPQIGATFKRDAGIHVDHGVDALDLVRQFHHGRGAMLERAAGMRADTAHLPPPC